MRCVVLACLFPVTRSVIDSFLHSWHRTGSQIGREHLYICAILGLMRSTLCQAKTENGMTRHSGFRTVRIGFSTEVAMGDMCVSRVWKVCAMLWPLTCAKASLLSSSCSSSSSVSPVSRSDCLTEANRQARFQRPPRP
ncbi:hypothetical protein EJ02DRAFT_29898 [Clathrospora elynae]|uniref:Secreted protein n=1 Tax=Clathrospora elynae TaxID=706981 RepID=A0A6A5SEC3_9PLEO|nr:hypothetical protein EJ02DRAFT_29898 [Clathrospora elynae]